MIDNETKNNGIPIHGLKNSHAAPIVKLDPATLNNIAKIQTAKDTPKANSLPTRGIHSIAANNGENNSTVPRTMHRKPKILKEHVVDALVFL